MRKCCDSMPVRWDRVLAEALAHVLRGPVWEHRDERYLSNKPKPGLLFSSTESDEALVLQPDKWRRWQNGPARRWD